jgi:GTP cyclohydrolase I
MIDLGNDDARISKSLVSNNPRPVRRMGELTRMPGKCVTASIGDASETQDGEILSEKEIRACTACEHDFVVMRPWQRQCSPRCRQRTYIQRKTTVPLGYYGA